MNTKFLLNLTICFSTYDDSMKTLRQSTNEGHQCLDFAHKFFLSIKRREDKPTGKFAPTDR